ncbi:hypothetical protein EFT87_08235, partial [Schleiferilactobacillus harbinensis]|nr:hypothetical protein [Schleiferilactobacillus harbinensis]
GLPPMWLGDFETAVFAGSKRRHHVPAQFCRRLRSIGTAYQREFCSSPPLHELLLPLSHRLG